MKKIDVSGIYEIIKEDEHIVQFVYKPPYHEFDTEMQNVVMPKIINWQWKAVLSLPREPIGKRKFRKRRIMK